MIDSVVCPRCKKEKENWNHIWECTENEFNEENITLLTMKNLEDKYNNNGKIDKYKCVCV